MNYQFLQEAGDSQLLSGSLHFSNGEGAPVHMGIKHIAYGPDLAHGVAMFGLPDYGGHTCWESLHRCRGRVVPEGTKAQGGHNGECSPREDRVGFEEEQRKLQSHNKDGLFGVKVCCAGRDVSTLTPTF